MDSQDSGKLELKSIKRIGNDKEISLEAPIRQLTINCVEIELKSMAD